VRKLNEEEMRELYASRSQDTPMDFEDFDRLEERKVNQGRFRGGEYFIRFVKAPAEVGESYGDRRYTLLGQAEIEATVADASEAIFTPCTYRIEDVQWVGGQHGAPLLPEEIVSFRGRFCEQAREGERVIAKGKLERVVVREEKAYHRLLLGGRGDSMIVKRDA
jgi:predicted nucleotidyltransferase